MSYLPSAIDTPLTEKDIEDAKSRIVEALAKLSRGNAPKPLAPSKVWNAETLAQLDDLYENMEWITIASALSEAQPGASKLPKQLEARMRFTVLMSSDEDDLVAAYRNAVQNLKSDVTYGDMYIGLGLAKLNHFDVVDCASLLSLASLCPNHHKRALQFAQDKLAWTIENCRSSILSLDKRMRSAEAIQMTIDANPTMKEALTDVDIAVKQWHSATTLERYKLMHEWNLDPVLNFFIRSLHAKEIAIRHAGVSLLGMPRNVFGRIMEYAGVAVMRDISKSCILGDSLMEDCTAWRYHLAITMNAPSDSLPTDTNEGTWPFVLSQQVELKSLETANAWDKATMLPIKEHYGAIIYSVQPAPCITIFAVSVANFTTLIEAIVLVPSVLQWLVSSTNFHMTMGRFICSLAYEELPLLCNFLHFLLSSGVDDSTKWINDLKDAGLERLLLAKAGMERRAEPLRLLAFMKLHHLLIPENVDSTYLTAVNTALSHTESDEARDLAMKTLPGVYHLAGLASTSTSESSMGPFYASFQVDPQTIKITEHEDITEDEDAAINPFGLDFYALSETVMVKMRGIGKVVNELGELIFAEMSLKLVVSSDVQGNHTLNFIAHVKGLDISISGSNSKYCLAGESHYWKTDMESPDYDPRVPQGFSLLWKSPLPDTETNWVKHMNDLNQLHSARTAGVYGERRRESLAEKHWFSLPAPFSYEALFQKSISYNFPVSFAIHSRSHHSLNYLWESIHDPRIGEAARTDNVLPRDDYESDQVYELRNEIIRHLEVIRFPMIRNHTLASVATDRCFEEVLVFGNAFIRLLKTLQPMRDSKFAPEELLNAWQQTYEFLPTPDYWEKLIGACQTALELIKTASVDGKDPSKPAKVPITEILQPFFLDLHTRYTKNHYANPVKCAKGVSTLINWMLNDNESNEAVLKVDSRIGETLSTTDSAPLRAMLAETQRFESGNEFTRLYRKWMHIWNFSSPALDAVSSSISPGFLFYSLAFSLNLAKDEEDDARSNAQSSDYAYAPFDTSDDESYDSDSEEEQQSLNIPALIVGGTVCIAAVTAGAFFIGRMLTKKKIENL